MNTTIKEKSKILYVPESLHSMAKKRAAILEMDLTDYIQGLIIEDDEKHPLKLSIDKKKL
jgi:hypothetical protein